MTDSQIAQTANNVIRALADIEESFRMAKLEALRRETALFSPLYAQRARITRGVPKFWQTVLCAEDELVPYIGLGERALLQHLVDIQVLRTERDPRNFVLEFQFTPNDFLQESSLFLRKEFTVKNGFLMSTKVPISWKPDRDLTDKNRSVNEKEGIWSLFNLFSFTTSELEDERSADEASLSEDIATLIAEEIFPHALGYFTDAMVPSTAETSALPTRDISGASTPGENDTMSHSFLDSMVGASTQGQGSGVSATPDLNGLKELNGAKVSAGSKTHDLGKLAGSGKTHQLNALAPGVLEAYASANSTALPFYLLNHRKNSIEAFNEYKMITVNQAQVMLFLANLAAPKRVLEIGTFTGFSAMVFSEIRGVEEVTTLECDEELAAFAKLAIHASGKSNVVSVIKGDAHTSLAKLPSGYKDRYDLIFIDAEKTGYLKYLKTIVSRNLLSKDGIVIADNTLRRGYVASELESDTHDPEFEQGVKAIREFNAYVVGDDKLESVVVPVFDGFSLIKYK